MANSPMDARSSRRPGQRAVRPGITTRLRKLSLCSKTAKLDRISSVSSAKSYSPVDSWKSIIAVTVSTASLSADRRARHWGRQARRSGRPVPSAPGRPPSRASFRHPPDSSAPAKMSRTFHLRAACRGDALKQGRHHTLFDLADRIHVDVSPLSSGHGSTAALGYGSSGSHSNTRIRSAITHRSLYLPSPISTYSTMCASVPTLCAFPHHLPHGPQRSAPRRTPGSRLPRSPRPGGVSGSKSQRQLFIGQHRYLERKHRCDGDLDVQLADQCVHHRAQVAVVDLGNPALLLYDAPDR